ncbi:MAG: HAD-IA family hydrolase [Verrucomicrobia bacterium]|nr:HAD-IA family hydrolase [Verrucomicrobiota bacterium]
MNTGNQPIIEAAPLSVEAIVFDVGGTLIEPCPSVGHIYADVASGCGHSDLDPTRLNDQFAEAWRAKGDFQYNENDWERLVIRTFEGLVSEADCRIMFPKLYQRFEDPGVWKVHADVLPTLDDLAGRGFRLGIVSNWDTRLRPLLDNLRLEGFFELISVSCDIGFTKPSPVIFEHTISKFGLPPDRILHVGDVYEEDVMGAQTAGLQALHIDRTCSGEKGKLCQLTDLIPLVKEAWI